MLRPEDTAASDLPRTDPKARVGSLLAQPAGVQSGRRTATDQALADPVPAVAGHALPVHRHRHHGTDHESMRTQRPGPGEDRAG